MENLLSLLSTGKVNIWGTFFTISTDPIIIINIEDKT